MVLDYKIVYFILQQISSFFAIFSYISTFFTVDILRHLSTFFSSCYCFRNKKEDLDMKQQDIFSTKEEFRLQMKNLIKGYTPEEKIEILREQLDNFLSQVTQTLKCQSTYLPQPYVNVITQYAISISKNCSFQRYHMDYSLFFNRCCNCMKPYISKGLQLSETERFLTKNGIVFLQPDEEHFLILTIQQMKIVENELQQILTYSILSDKYSIITHIQRIKDLLFRYALTFYLPFLHNRKKSFYTSIYAADCEESVEQALISLFWEELMNFDINKHVRFTTALHHKTSAIIQEVLNQRSPFSMDLRMRKTIHLITDEIKNRTCALENIVEFITKKYHVRIDIAHLLCISSGDIYAIPKNFEDLTDTHFAYGYTSSELSNIELHLSINKNFSALEKHILQDILEYGTVILK